MQQLQRRHPWSISLTKKEVITVPIDKNFNMIMAAVKFSEIQLDNKLYADDMGRNMNTVLAIL